MIVNPTAPDVNAHIWGRNSENPIPGAVIYMGRRDLFIPNDVIPEIVKRLQAIHDLNA